MKRLLTFGILLFCLSLGTTPTPQAQKSDASSDKAKVVDAFGTVQKQIGGDKAAWQNLNVGDLLTTQTTVKTGDKSAVLLQLPEGHVFRIGAGTTVLLKELGKDKAFSFQVLSGHVWSFVRRAAKPTKYEIETPSAVVGVSGTVFSVFHDPNLGETSVSTGEGIVHVRQGNHQPLEVRKGFFANLRIGQRQAVRVLAQNDMNRKMWMTLRQNETWVEGRDTLRLNRATELIYRPFGIPPPPGGQNRQRHPGERPPRKP